MRDLILYTALLGGIPWYFFNPFYGILAFHLVSIMNPHRYTWGSAYSFPFAMYIAAATILGVILGRGERNPLPKERETFMLAGLWLIFVISSYSSLVPDLSMPELERTSKILLMTFLTMLLCCNKERLRYLFWIVALSMGAIGIKSGLFGILTGGGFKVWGPPDTFIADNNDVGLAFNIALPIMYHLATNEASPRARKFMMAVFFLTVLATILTFSRGAAVVLAFILFVLAFMSKRRVRNLVILAVLGFSLSFFVSDAWKDRMATIDDAKEDASFMGRVNAWHNAWNIASDHPLTGGGLAATQSRELFKQYAPDPDDFHASHNIYFQMLAENGFPGLTLFLLLLASILLSLEKIRRKFVYSEEVLWLSRSAGTLQLSIMAFSINGLTLGRAYFDLAFLVIVMGIMLKVLAKEHVVKEQASCRNEADICAV